MIDEKEKDYAKTDDDEEDEGERPSTAVTEFDPMTLWALKEVKNKVRR